VIAQTDCDRALDALCQAFKVNTTAIPAAFHQQQAIAKTHPQQIAAPVPPPVRGVALDQNQARVAIRYVPDNPGMAARIFSLLADHNISVDMIIQSQRCRLINGLPTRDIAFTVAQADANTAHQVLNTFAQETGCGEVTVAEDIAKVSVVGSGMVGQPGVAARFFAALAQEQINIQMIATSEIKVSCVVARSDGVKALKAVHEAFALAGKEQITVPA
jgi:aspartate kinase